MQARVAPVGAMEALGEQVDSLLPGQPPRVEDLDLAGVGLGIRLPRVEAGDVHTPLPAADRRGVGAEVEQRAVRRGARREDPRVSAVEGAERHPRDRLDLAVAAAHSGVGAELGVVAADQRRAGDPAEQRRADPGRARGGDVDQVVAALGEGLDHRRQSGHAELQSLVERNLELRGGRQAAVDARVGADHLDLEAGDPALADLFDRPGDPVHRLDPVRDQGDARQIPARVVRSSLVFSAPRKAVAGA